MPERDSLTPKDIVSIRKETLGLTQEQFAQALGVGRRSVARWEGGESKPLQMIQRAIRDLKTAATKTKKKG